MSLLLAVENFLNEFRSEKPLLIDARSPAEFLHAHIPGAVNIPLLNNEQRAVIGTTFKKEGREAAILKGFDLVGPHFGEMVREVKSLTTRRELFIYCWRGGLRSNIISWVLSTGGYQTTLLKGGYKSYRSWVLSELNKERKFMVIGGRTGSGKTEILNALAKYNPVIDLEGLSHHKGSAFGHLGQLPQPGNEQYENLVAEKLCMIPPDKTIWIENESRNIGSVKIPDKIFQGIRDSFTIEITLDTEVRKKRILAEYGIFPIELLAETTKKIRKRLGEVRLKQALEFLQNGQLDDWVTMMLDYYDKTYNYGMELRHPETVLQLDVSPLDDVDAAAKKILAQIAMIKQQTGV